MAEVVVEDPIESSQQPSPAEPGPETALDPENPKTVLDNEPDSTPTVTEFPENWRDLMSGEDEKTRKLLDRYASPQAAGKALLDFRKKISDGDLAKPLGDNPTDEELADYRANLGIPANASDYNTEVDGVVYGEEDKEIIGGFLEFAHKANYTPSQVEAGLKWYNSFQEQELALQADLDAETVNKTIDDLRLEYGADYRRNMNVLDSHLTTVFGDQAADIKNARLADGTPLLANAGIIRAFVNAGIEANPLSTVVPNAGANQASAIEDELKEIASLQFKDPKKFWATETQERQLELIAAKENLPKM